MYTVTFYSFKGGVGRSMAMMNTAFTLIAEGKKVLVVDFDLEAPGLDTFALPNSANKNLGVVDFVCDYIKTGIAPEIDEYCFRSSTDDSSGGELWLMPAGRRDEKYADLMNSINWRELYDKRDGYLLLEDLKAQWKSYLKPDYVLIDSRTGHTDEGGICTRQLPNAVVCLFFPNRQNLIGLTRAVNRIRKENDIRKEKFPGKESIILHFVTSNVPDLDDENSVLEETLSDFETELQYSELAATIHHYPSLALLNQDIFTRDRPKSRLAAEYRQLVTAIQKENPKDKRGSLMFLSDELEQLGKVPLEKRNEEHLKRIFENHGEDVEVLKNLIDLRYRQRQFEETEELLSRALGLDNHNPDLLFRKVILSDKFGQTKQAIENALMAVQQPELGGFELNQIVRLLANKEPSTLKKIDSWPAIKNMSEHELVLLTEPLSFTRSLLSSAELLIRFILAKLDRSPQTEATLISKIRNGLVLNLIGQKRFSEAIDICNNIIRNDPFDQSSLFNLAIATWGEAPLKMPPVDMFQSALDFGTNKPSYSANYLQCMSLANWVTGKSVEAKEFLGKAKHKVVTAEFSCWSFLYRTPRNFLQELEQQEKMFSDKEILPEVIEPLGFPFSS